MNNQECNNMLDQICDSVENVCPILDENGKQVGEYQLLDKSVYTIKIGKEHRRQGYATRTMTELYNKGIITGPSDSVVSRHIVAIWKKLGVDVGSIEDLTDVMDTLE